MNAGRGNLWFPGRIAPLDEHDNHMEIKIIMLLWVFFIPPLPHNHKKQAFSALSLLGPAKEK